MTLDEETRQILESSSARWNETELIVKKVEQLRGEVVIPAIGELRYAGRKLVDYIMAMDAGAPDDTCKKHVYDFEQCCIRARHDAVDGAVMYMKTYYSNMVTQFGIDTIVASYRHNAELRKAISIVEKRVLISREERHKRNDLYTEINDGNLDRLLECFGELVDSEPVIIGVREARDREHRLSVRALVVGVIAAALGAIGLLVALWPAVSGFLRR
jgi:hypothetical protein